MKKFFIIFILLIFGSALIYTQFINKTPEEKICSRLEQFEQAYADGDLNACIDCFDARTRNAYKGVGTLGSMIGGNVGLFNFNLGSDTLGALFSLGVAKGDEQVKFTVKSIKIIDQEHATVDAEIWTNADGVFSETTEAVTFDMKREPNSWYLFWQNDWYISEKF
ncbi:MAG: hypothetical protein MJ168_05300 [Clostridia bacterium]|nr:hypothetical protein [Clostridia bacterium]